jgi:meiotically up-regulated gene 157 (Mug157) protein
VISRRDLLRFGALGAAAALAGPVRAVAASPSGGSFASRRPPPGKRKFASPAVETQIAQVKARIGDPELAWLFENCYPNTLDTTVEAGTLDGKPDTFVITGDIDAMWLRDSSAQVWPYVPLAARDAPLRRLLRGLIRRQARCIALDPYANAFLPDPRGRSTLSWAQADLTEMKPGVAERKWEIDSLCYPVRLAHAYWRATGDREPFDGDWRAAMRLVVATFRAQQRKDGPGPYHFQRPSANPTDTQFLGGYGNPTRPVGLIHAAFRPSDDACIYPFNVPGNLFAVAALRLLAPMAQALYGDRAFADECVALADEVARAADAHGVMDDGQGGEVWAYEVDGYGNRLFMDDANAPGLSSLAYLGCCAPDDARYRRSRALAWSPRNPYFFRGRAAEGIGGPHQGLRMIWPLSITMRALTSDDDGEIRQCLAWLKAAHAGTGFMHEAFDQDDPAKYTRPWFAWANTLFGELIVRLARQRPRLLAA